jgi:hypothetical protein
MQSSSSTPSTSSSVMASQETFDALILQLKNADFMMDDPDKRLQQLYAHCNRHLLLALVLAEKWYMLPILFLKTDMIASQDRTDIFLIIKTMFSNNKIHLLKKLFEQETHYLTKEMLMLRANKKMLRLPENLTKLSQLERIILNNNILLIISQLSEWSLLESIIDEDRQLLSSKILDMKGERNKGNTHIDLDIIKNVNLLSLLISNRQWKIITSLINKKRDLITPAQLSTASQGAKTTASVIYRLALAEQWDIIETLFDSDRNLITPSMLSEAPSEEGYTILGLGTRYYKMTPLEELLIENCEINLLVRFMYMLQQMKSKPLLAGSTYKLPPSAKTLNDDLKSTPAFEKGILYLLNHIAGNVNKNHSLKALFIYLMDKYILSTFTPSLLIPFTTEIYEELKLSAYFIGYATQPTNRKLPIQAISRIQEFVSGLASETNSQGVTILALNFFIIAGENNYKNSRLDMLTQLFFNEYLKHHPNLSLLKKPAIAQIKINFRHALTQIFSQHFEKMSVRNTAILKQQIANVRKMAVQAESHTLPTVTMIIQYLFDTNTTITLKPLPLIKPKILSLPTLTSQTLQTSFAELKMNETHSEIKDEKKQEGLLFHEMHNGNLLLTFAVTQQWQLLKRVLSKNHPSLTAQMFNVTVEEGLYAGANLLLLLAIHKQWDLIRIFVTKESHLITPEQLEAALEKNILLDPQYRNRNALYLLMFNASEDNTLWDIIQTLFDPERELITRNALVARPITGGRDKELNAEEILIYNAGQQRLPLFIELINNLYAMKSNPLGTEYPIATIPKKMSLDTIKRLLVLCFKTNNNDLALFLITKYNFITACGNNLDISSVTYKYDHMCDQARLIGWIIQGIGNVTPYMSKQIQEFTFGPRMTRVTLYDEKGNEKKIDCFRSYIRQGCTDYRQNAYLVLTRLYVNYFNAHYRFDTSLEAKPQKHLKENFKKAFTDFFNGKPTEISNKALRQRQIQRLGIFAHNAERNTLPTVEAITTHILEDSPSHSL